MEILSGGLLLAMMVLVLWLVVGAPGRGRRGGGGRGWGGAKRAQGAFNTWLALTGATLFYLEVAVGYAVPAGLIVAGIVLAVIGLHLARPVVEPLLALAGVAAVALAIHREFGANTAVLVLVVVILATWLAGAMAVVTGRRFGS